MTEYKRIVIKISGEALSDGSNAISGKSAEILATQLKEIVKIGVQTCVVVGGGNIWRGRTSAGMDRTTADSIGMLATVMNGLALSEALTACGVKNKVVSSLSVANVVDADSVSDVIEYLNEGKLVIFVGGTGLPYFSTDTALTLRACEIHADAIFFMKNVDGIYDSDPKTNPNAKKYDEISFDRILKDNLQAMDMTAAAMCREYGMTAVALGKDEKNGILRVLKGEKLGTIIK
ncbi:MAG: UMP kinase [Corallococcus sp.]|nr:UMP kinase [Bacillota bacterium]MCM1534127.1 UMP kinase [Corallococcus sp.]